ncbi:hypothetical protein [Streptomyces sp. WZ-12]|uniref:hypothetical protein n=1 Tax=Streptomyces sp. WZ-12 TaxID=3030210 RepID=UPI0023810CCA|nr:hypothetical protein [Streptomyces sp. WZ-12]
MRKSMDRTGRGAVCAVAAPALSAALTSAVAAPPPRESSPIPFAERFHAAGHGGIARAANSWVTWRRDCATAARAGDYQASAGSWALVAVCGNRRVPLRRPAVRDGGEARDGRRRTFAVRLAGLRLRAHTRGPAGVVTYHGTSGNGSENSARAGRITPVVLRHSAELANAATNPTYSDFNRKRPGAPACRNAPGFDSEVLDPTPALRYGGDRSTFRFTTRKAGYSLGALFVQAGLRH